MGEDGPPVTICWKEECTEFFVVGSLMMPIVEVPVVIRARIPCCGCRFLGRCTSRLVGGDSACSMQMSVHILCARKHVPIRTSPST